MSTQNYTTADTDDRSYFVNLPPLADGTPVKGIISEGEVIGTDAEWRGIKVGTGFTFLRNKPYVDLYFDDPMIEKQFPVATWSQRRKRLEAKMPRRMAALIEHNIIEQIIERARNWQPQLFD
jgi:hypothetical protein